MQDSNLLQINCRQGSQDFDLFLSIVNQGIDSRLEAFTKSVFQLQPKENRINFCFHQDEMQILIRRLTEKLEEKENLDFEDNSGTDEWLNIYSWISDIIETTYNRELI